MKAAAALLPLLLSFAQPASAQSCKTDFSDHPATLRAPAKPAAVQIRTRVARQYRTHIGRSTADGKPDFAGAYDIVPWTCGTGCHRGVYIDQRTGVVFQLPNADLGYEYRPKSRLLIVNDRAAVAQTKWILGKPARSHYYVLGRSGLQFLCSK